MAGYDNYSMSNNAIKAYEDGEKPLSKWRKTDIIEEIEFLVEEGEIELKCSMNTLTIFSKNSPTSKVGDELHHFHHLTIVT